MNVRGEGGGLPCGAGCGEGEAGKALGGSGKRGVHPGPAGGSLRNRRRGAGGSIRTRLQPLLRERLRANRSAWPCPEVSHLGPSLSPSVGWAAKRSGFLIRYPPAESASNSLFFPHTLDSTQSCWSHLCSPAPPHLAQPPSPLPYIPMPAWLATLPPSGPI